MSAPSVRSFLLKILTLKQMQDLTLSLPVMHAMFVVIDAETPNKIITSYQVSNRKDVVHYYN